MRISTSPPISSKESSAFSFQWKKTFFVLFFLMSSTIAVFGSHFRYGVMTATRLSETPTTVTYQVTLSTSWNLAWNFGTTTPSHTIVRSGGNTGSFTVTGPLVLDPSGQWRNHTATATVVLNKSATPTRLSFASNAKISTISNNANQPWDVFCILNTNAPGNPPVSNMPAIINMPIGAPAATYSVPVSDPDAGTTFTFGTPSFTGNLLNSSNPVGFSINTSGLITFNTVGKSVGQQYNAMITVKDNDGNTIFLDFLINMVGPSNPPAFDYTVTPTNGTEFNVIAGQTLNFGIKATDPDINSTVSLSVAGLNSAITLANFSANSLPATGNPAVTNFSYTPNGAAIGSSTVLNFSATDNVGVQSSTSVTIKVVAEPAPVFVAPTPVLNSARQILTGVLHQDQIVASSSLGSNVSIAFATIPAGATLSPAVPTVGANPATTTLSWTPTPANWGLHNLNFQAVISNIPSIFTQHNYQIEVNTPPVFASTPPASLTVMAGQPFTYNIVATDPDIPFGDHLDIIAATKPAWLTLTQTSPTTAVLTGSPTAADAGANTVHLELEDIYHHGNPSHVEQEFTITVIAGVAPTIVGPGNITLNTSTGLCGAVVNFAATETVGIPASTITYSVAPGSLFNVGTTPVTATATNSIGSSSVTFNVIVVDNQAPVISNPPTNIVVSCESIPALVALSVSDNCTIANTLMYEYMGTGMKTDLVHSYNFDNALTDANGTSTPTNVGGVAFAPSISGSALSFDGGNKFVNLGTNASLNGAINFGLSVWVKTSSGSPMTVVQQRDGQYNGQYILNIGSDHNGGNQFPGKVYFMVYNNAFQFELISNVRVDDGKWHHIVAERQGTNGRVFVDGVLVASGSGPFLPLNGTIGSYVGRDVRDNSKPFVGLIDQLNIYAGGSTPKNYDLERTWSYADASGNISMAQQIVTVEDNTAPVIGNSSITTPTQVDGSVIATSAAGAVVNYTLPTATDNCSNNVIVTSTPASGSVFQIGTTTITFTAVDEVGNIATKTMDITVKGIAPSIVVPPTITVASPANACGAVVNFSATETTGIPASTITYSHAPGSNFILGTTVVTATATNAVGTSVSTFEVIVKDLTPPVFPSFIADVTLYATSANGAVFQFANPTAFDNCSGVLNTVATPASGSVFPIGTTQVAVTAVDGSNNAITRYFKVTVVGVPPVIVVPANISVNNDAANCGAVVNFTATETTAIPASTIVYSHQPGSVFPIGTTTVTVTATNAVGSDSKTFTVTVVDNTNPVLSLAPSDVTVECDAVPAAAVLTATDNCSAVVTMTETRTNGINANNYILTRVWTATDPSGNTVSATQIVTVRDTKAPSLTVPANISVNNDNGICGATVSFAASATDNCSDVTITYSKNPGTVFPVGTTEVTVTATDATGNAISNTFTVTVTDNEKPVINTPAAPVFCENTAGTYTLPTVTATDNCGVASVSFAITGVTQRIGTGFDAGTAFNVGVSTITYTVTDVNGNVSTKSVVVTVNKAPTATIAVSSPDAFCNKLVLVSNSTSAISGYAWSYNNANFASTQAVSLDNTNGDGTYSVYVTDNKGCTSLTAVSYQYSKQNTISNYTILAYKEAELKEYNTVQTGSVGVMSKKGKAEIGKNSSVAAPGAFVKAPKIEVKQGANVPVRLIGVATVSLPTMQYNTSNTNNLPNYTTNQGATVSLSGNYKNLKIRKGSNVTLSGNTYGNIEIEEGSVVRFTSTVINVEHLKVGKGPNNGLTQVRFADNTSIRVAKHVQIEEDCFINPDGYKVTFYLGKQSNHDCNKHRNNHGNGHDNDDDDDDRDDDDHDRGHGDGDQKFEVKGGNTTVIANVYAPTGDIKVKGGEGCHKNHSSTVVKMTGLFIGYEVEGDGRNIIWNSYACGTAAPIAAADAQPVYNKTAEEVVVADDLKVTVMPNPSTTYFTLKLVSKSDLPVNIKVVDAAGRLVDAKAKQAANSTLQLGHSYATGNYFAEFIQGNQRKVVQLMKIK